MTWLYNGHRAYQDAELALLRVFLLSFTAVHPRAALPSPDPIARDCALTPQRGSAGLQRTRLTSPRAKERSDSRQEPSALHPRGRVITNAPRAVCSLPTAPRQLTTINDPPLLHLNMHLEGLIFPPPASPDRQKAK